MRSIIPAAVLLLALIQSAAASGEFRVEDGFKSLLHLAGALLFGIMDSAFFIFLFLFVSALLLSAAALFVFVCVSVWRLIT